MQIDGEILVKPLKVMYSSLQSPLQKQKHL